MTPQSEYHHTSRGGKQSTARFLAQILAGTDLLIDVAACKDTFFAFAVQRNPTLEIVTAEPDAVSREILCRNVVLAKRDGTQSREVAVGCDTYAANGNIAIQLAQDTRQIEHSDVEPTTTECSSRRPLRRLVVRTDSGQHVPTFLTEIEPLLDRGLDLRLLVEMNCERQPGTAFTLLPHQFDELGFSVFLIDDDEDRFYRIRSDGDLAALSAGRRSANLYCVPQDRALSVVFFAHSAGASGAERSLMELVDEMITDYGTICTVVSPGSEGPLVDSVTRSGAAVLVADLPWWGGSPTDQGATVIRTNLVRGIRDTCRCVLPVLEKVDPDVVFTQTLTVPFGAFAARVLGKPHAWNICEFGEIDHGFEFSDPFADILAAIAAGSSFVFTNSDAIRVTLFPGFDPERIRTIYRHITIPQDVRAADGVYLQAGAVRLGLFGTLHEGKGQHEALEAVAELVRRGRDVELLLAGYSPSEHYRARIDNLVDELGLRERVRIVGFLNNPHPVMAAADICLVCSRNEAFGRVAAEAMLLGRPVVYARSGGVAEYMREGVTGLAYTPGHAAELADQIEALIDNPAGRAAIAAAARRHAQATFTRDGYSGAVFRVLLGLRGTVPNVDTPTRLVKAMAEAISADATTIAELRTVQSDDATEIARLRGSLCAGTREVAGLREALYAGTREIAGLRATLSEAENATLLSDHILRETQARLNAIEVSTSWRLTGALRLFFAANPGMRRMIRSALKCVWSAVTIELPRRLYNRQR